MANKESNTYIMGFAAVVCLVCSVVVSFSAVSLKDRQEENKQLDKQKKVLTVAGLMDEGEKIPPAEVKELFATIEPRLINLETGEYVEDQSAAATFDQRKESKDPKTSVDAPAGNLAKVKTVPKQALVYLVMKNDKPSKIILPIEGKGLWSTLYGFIALETDTTTVAGITFYEHGETPGLGGEVDNPSWKALWKGRKVFDDEWKPKIEVVKGMAGPAAEAPYKVDGLSGATLTSRGVTHLVHFWTGEAGYGPYLAKFREKQAKGGK